MLDGSLDNVVQTLFVGLADVQILIYHILLRCTVFGSMYYGRLHKGLAVTCHLPTPEHFKEIRIIAPPLSGYQMEAI